MIKWVKRCQMGDHCRDCVNAIFIRTSLVQFKHDMDVICRKQIPCGLYKESYAMSDNYITVKADKEEVKE